MARTLQHVSWAALSAAFLFAIQGCSDDGGAAESRTPVGALATDPATGLAFVADGHAGGHASALEIESIAWGRLVDVYDRDEASGERQLVLREAVIDPALESDGEDYELEDDAGGARLTILHARTSEAFARKLREALEGVQPIAQRDLDAAELPPWDAVARNAALVLSFNDLLDDGDLDQPGSIVPESVRLFSGSPPIEEFRVRVVRDSTHGALVAGRFHSTRVIVDLTVSESDAISCGLPVQLAGLPAATSTAVPNVALVVPTIADASAGQPVVLRNLSGRPLANSMGSSSLFATTTQPIVRAFRSRGVSGVTGDPSNGYLSDPVAPRIVGNHPVQLTFVGPGGAPKRFVVDIAFGAPACMPVPHENDRLYFPNHVARVLVSPNPPGNGVLDDVLVQLVSGNPATFGPMSGRYSDPFVGAAAQAPDCYVTFAPAAASLPNAGVAKHAKVMVRFSEPIDPASARPLDSLSVSYGSPAASSPIYSRVVGDVVADNGLQLVLLVPKEPLRHTQGVATNYFVDVLGGANGIRDLAGNPLATPLHADFQIDPNETSIDSGSFALRFSSADEDGDGAPEIRGGVLFDLATDRVIPRGVARFSALADSPTPTVAAMTPLSVPVQSPLSAFGSRAMMTWRYHDLGFPLRDPWTHDLDVEGLNWSPFGGALNADSFAQFEMAFAHSKFLPDEQLSSGLLPNWGASGLVSTFANDLLDPLNDPSVVVHPRSRGYTIDPNDAFVAANGAVMAPWPLNQNVPPNQFTYWTWRDTGKISLGGPNGTGADTARLQQVTKVAQKGFYPVNKVPTIGLPILMEFRTWPDSNALGLNGLRVAIAINSSARPAFRAHSTGGVNPQNPSQVRYIDPDNEPIATGSYNAWGWISSPLDNVFSYGQADFVVRISRMHTRWFDTFGTNTQFAEPYVEHGSPQPPGTQIVVAFRGAHGFTLNNPPSGVLPFTRASLMDSYGDGYTAAQLAMLSQPQNLAFTPLFAATPPNTLDRRWQSTVGAINGARYLQARVSFVSNAQTGLGGDLSALGFSYRR